MGTMDPPLDTVVRVRLSERRSATQEGSVGGRREGRAVHSVETAGAKGLRWE